MRNIPYIRLLETYGIGFVGGYLFYLLDLPLPWVLGSIAFIIIYQAISKRNVYCPTPLKESGFLLLGTSFGLYFTLHTFQNIGPYIIPYIILTLLLIFVSIINSLLVTKWIGIDRVTSVFSGIPGGLSEMVIASESLNAKSSLVAIFQTIRLVTVLFLVPFIVVHLFYSPVSPISSFTSNSAVVSSSNWLYLLYIIPVIFGVKFKNVFPAGVIIIPLAITALINITIGPIPALPSLLLIFAQVTVGIGIGKGISISDIKKGGKYGAVYFLLSVFLIFVSIGLGLILSLVTEMSMTTAILSVAPGGLIEMALTAKIIGGDPAIVTSLQLIRILIIVMFVPSFLKWFFTRKNQAIV